MLALVHRCLNGLTPARKWKAMADQTVGREFSRCDQPGSELERLHLLPLPNLPSVRFRCRELDLLVPQRGEVGAQELKLVADKNRLPACSRPA